MNYCVLALCGILGLDGIVGFFRLFVSLPSHFLFFFWKSFAAGVSENGLSSCLHALRRGKTVTLLAPRSYRYRFW
jgi:hypothetical protein